MLSTSFILLINIIILSVLSVCFVIVFFYLYAWRLSYTVDITSRYLLHYLRIWHGDLPQEFATGLCRENFQWLFNVRICRGYLHKNLPQKFATTICHDYLPRVYLRTYGCSGFQWVQSGKIGPKLVIDVGRALIATIIQEIQFKFS